MEMVSKPGQGVYFPPLEANTVSTQELDDMTHSRDRWALNFSKMSQQCDAAWGEMDRLRDGIHALMRDMESGPLDDCCYGGGCVATAVTQRLQGLVDLTPTGDAR